MAKRTYSDSVTLDNTVLNDANIVLDYHHLEALSKGLSFVPTPKPKSKDQFTPLLDRLRRTINLHLFWNVRNNTRPPSSIISRLLPSEWDPPQTLPHSKIWDDCLEALSAAPRLPSNLSHGARKAWRELATHPNAFTTKADKGGKIVIWRHIDYEKEAHRQLSDSTTYEELEEVNANTAYGKLINQRDATILSLKKGGFITPAEANHLTSAPHKIPAIYFIPKIHKPKRTDTNTFAGRPIIAAFPGPLKILDEFLAHLTTPLLDIIPGSLKDTTSLINQLQAIGPTPTGTTLFSADVESLYPSIPWEEGIASATRFYARNFHIVLKEARLKRRLPPPNPKLFRTILTMVLTNNFFHFQNKKWFRQLKGTAMGCSISVYFANTFMYYRTQKLIETPPPELIYLGRYIDDLIGIWKGTPSDIPLAFKDTVDDSLKLTYVFGGNKLEALDLLISLEPDGTLYTSLFRKPTDGHQFLHYESAHPPSLKRSLPFSQMLRLKRNCSRDSDYTKEACALLNRFLARGYPKRLLLNSFLKTTLRSRKDLLGFTTKTRRNKPHRFAFISNYAPGQHQATREAITTLYNAILQDPRVQEMKPYLTLQLPTLPPLLAYTCSGNLGSSLGRAFKQGHRDNDRPIPIFTSTPVKNQPTSGMNPSRPFGPGLSPIPQQALRARTLTYTSTFD
jgi:hypothetical protein